MQPMIVGLRKFSAYDGPGIRTAVYVKGCPLACVWCPLPEAQRREAEILTDGSVVGESMDVEAIARACLQDRLFYEESGGGVTLSGGEPLLFPAFSRKLLRRLRAEGIHAALETSGHVKRDVLLSTAAEADLVLYSCKHYDSKKHRSGTSMGNTAILRNLRALAATGQDILVRVPIVPGYNDSLEDARAFAAIFKNIGIKKVQLMPFHHMGEKKYALLDRPYRMAGYRALHTEDLRRIQEIFVGRGIICFQ